MASNYVNIKSSKKKSRQTPPSGSISSISGRSVAHSSPIAPDKSINRRDRLKAELFSGLDGSPKLRNAADYIKHNTELLSQPLPARKKLEKIPMSNSQPIFDISTIIGDSPISNNTKLGKKTNETIELLAKIESDAEIPADYKDCHFEESIRYETCQKQCQHKEEKESEV